MQLVDTVKIIYLLKKIGRHWKAVPRMRKASALPRKQPGSSSRICQVTNKHSTCTNSIEEFPIGCRVERGDAWQTRDRSLSLLRELACARFSDCRDVAKIKQASPPARFSQNVVPLPDWCTTIFQHAAGYPRTEALNWLVRLPLKRQPKPGERRIFVCFAPTKVLSWFAKSPNKHQRETQREFSAEAKCLLAG